MDAFNDITNIENISIEICRGWSPEYKVNNRNQMTLEEIIWHIHQKKCSIVESYLKTIFKDKLIESKFWAPKVVLCRPLFQENTSIKTNETHKIKINGVTFRYMATQGMASTATYQVLYKLLKH